MRYIWLGCRFRWHWFRQLNIIIRLLSNWRCSIVECVWFKRSKAWSVVWLDGYLLVLIDLVRWALFYSQWWNEFLRIESWSWLILSSLKILDAESITILLKTLLLVFQLLVFNGSSSSTLIAGFSWIEISFSSATLKSSSNLFKAKNKI